MESVSSTCMPHTGSRTSRRAVAVGGGAGEASAERADTAAASPSIQPMSRRRSKTLQETKINQSRKRTTRAKRFIIKCFTKRPVSPITPQGAVRAVYARRKGPVKRKGVISRGCEANLCPTFLDKALQIQVNPFSNNKLHEVGGNCSRDYSESTNLCAHGRARPHAAGIRSIPMYGRKTSGIRIEPSAC